MVAARRRFTLLVVMKEHAKILHDHPAFSLFSTRTLNGLTAGAVIVEYPKGSTIYSAGDEPRALFVVLSGRCQSTVLMPDRSEKVVSIFTPGDLFGERAVVSRSRHWHTVRVITDCRLLRIDAGDVHRLLDKSPKLARALVMRLINQIDPYRSPEPLHQGTAVALAGISAGIRVTREAENIAAALSCETGASVLVLAVRPDAAVPAEIPLEAIFRELLGGTMSDGAGIVRRYELRLPPSGAGADRAAPLISRLVQRYRYLISCLEADTPAPWVLAFMRQSDSAYLFFQQTPDDLYKSNLLMRQVREAEGGETTAMHAVVCPGENERPRAFADLSQAIGQPVRYVLHGAVRGSGAAGARAATRYQAHVRRIAREIGRCQIGLAFSSGGAKGLSYIGIIQVLEENGIDVDVIAGTSMGAYIGALWAYGLDGRELEALAQRMERPFALLRFIDPALPPRRGFMRGDRVARQLRKTMGDACFSELVRRLLIVATDLNTLERVVFESGEVARHVQASMAMPGVMVPVEVDGRTIIDGGIADPLPVDVLTEAGVERIIAVNTIPTPEEMKARAAHSRELAATPLESAAGLGSVNRVINYFAPGNILDIMMRSVHGAQTRVAERSCQEADIVLRPVLPDGRWHDFANPRKYIELGRAIAEARIGEIRALAGMRKTS